MLIKPYSTVGFCACDILKVESVILEKVHGRALTRQRPEEKYGGIQSDASAVESLLFLLNIITSGEKNFIS